MWMRRNASVRNGPGQVEPPFNPNHRRYRTCCCHCKMFTLGFGIVELFLICFVLVAIAPDFNGKICLFDNSEPHPTTTTTTMATVAQMDSTSQSTNGAPEPKRGEESPAFMQFIAQKRRRRRRQTIEKNGGQTEMPEVLALLAQKMSSAQTETMATTTPMTPVVNASPANEAAKEQEDNEGFSTTRLLRHITCNLTVLWLAWAILQMCSIGLMCYGVKRQRWYLLIPHILFRICCAMAVWLVMAALIGAFFHPGGRVTTFGHIALLLFFFLIFLWLGLLVKSEIRCCEFVKRSAETGFSISNTRPIGPPTVSQSDSARGGDHVRRVVQNGIRKMPGPNAKRYQTTTTTTKEHQGREEPQNGGGNEMTMSTLATGSGAQTRPSTAGSLAAQLQLGNGSTSRTSSATTTGERGMDGVEGGGGGDGGGRRGSWALENNETDFGGGGGSPDGAAKPGTLPPLRHTYKMAG